MRIFETNVPATCRKECSVTVNATLHTSRYSTVTLNRVIRALNAGGLNAGMRSKAGILYAAIAQQYDLPILALDKSSNHNNSLWANQVDEPLFNKFQVMDALLSDPNKSRSHWVKNQWDNAAVQREKDGIVWIYSCVIPFDQLVKTTRQHRALDAVDKTSTVRTMLAIEHLQTGQPIEYNEFQPGE